MGTKHIDKQTFLIFTAAELLLQEDTLKLEAYFRETNNWSSLNALIYISRINEEFDVLISSTDLAALHSFLDIYNLIVARKNGNN